MKGFKGLYPSIETLDNYKISLDKLTNVKEYSVLYYNNDENTVNLKLFYANKGETALLVD